MHMIGGSVEDYRVRLIQIAFDLATAGTGRIDPGAQAAFLRQFRTIYRHLAATVETSAGGVEPSPMMGMDPFMRTPAQVQELLDSTDAGIEELGR
jgi:hypothetical protein